MKALFTFILLLTSFSAFGQDTENWFAELKAIPDKADQLTFIKQRIVEDTVFRGEKPRIVIASHMVVEPEPLFVLIYDRSMHILDYKTQSTKALFQFLTTENIEKITVLRGDDAIALFGTRGKYGVVLLENQSPKFKRLVKRIIKEHEKQTR
ncbi:MAG: hypothetical protein AAF740_12465 [Bacteroidota bacterium]